MQPQHTHKPTPQRKHRPWLAAIAALLLTALLPATTRQQVADATPEPVGDITIYGQDGFKDLKGITADNNGNLWIADRGANAIIRTTLDGTDRTTYSDATITEPNDVVTGPNNTIWFTNPDPTNPRIGRIDPDGTVTTYGNPALPTPHNIAAGPDGNMWFTAGTTTPGSAIGQITPTGTISLYTSDGLFAPTDITAGPDGKMWFTNVEHPFIPELRGGIGKIGMGGDIHLLYDDSLPWTDHDMRDQYARPTSIVTGPDGNLWFTNRCNIGVSYGCGSIGKVTPQGDFTNYNVVEPGAQGPQHIIVGADNNLWYSSDWGIGRLTVDGTSTMFHAPGTSYPGGLTVAPDNRIWFTNTGNGASLSAIATDGTTENYAAISRPEAIVTTSQAVWYINSGNNTVGSRSGDGTFHQHNISPYGTPTAIIEAPDHNGVWVATYTETGPEPGESEWVTRQWGHIISIDNSGAITEIVTGDPNLGYISDMAAGNNTVWITNSGVSDAELSQIGSISEVKPDGTITHIENGAYTAATSLTVAADGTVWFGSTSYTWIGRVDVDGTPLAYTVPDGSFIQDVTVGPDNNIWFTSGYLETSAIGKLDVTTGEATRWTHAELMFLGDIVTGADGRLWFGHGQYGNGHIAAISTTGEIELHALPDGHGAGGVTADKTGNVWFASRGTNVIGKIVAAHGEPPEVPGAPTSVTATATQDNITVTWVAPTDDGGDPIVSYAATATPGNHTCTAPGTATSCTISGLTAGLTYTVTVTATNTGGTSTPSQPAEATPTTCDATAQGPFSDVGGTHQFCAPIEWMVANNIANGYPDGTFKPTAPVTRQAMAAFLYRAAGEPEVADLTQRFEDVRPGHPFYTPIAWMAETGLSTGTANPTGLPSFKPGEQVSRQAQAAFLYRAAGEPEVVDTTQRFEDVRDSHPFYTPIAWMAETGLSTGTANPPGLPSFKPVDPVSRQASAAFLHRAVQLGSL